MPIKVQAEIFLHHYDPETKTLTIKKIGTVYTPVYTWSFDGNGELKVEMKTSWDGS